ncbi:hypothetical protein FHG87_003836 [Trinorchestia longiramus]|nr:hypothetical protein FHG87_003836 [Trinorchestia longiramus]
MDNEQRSGILIKDNLKQISVYNDTPDLGGPNSVDNLLNSVQLQSVSHNKENSQSSVNSNEAPLHSNFPSGKMYNVMEENLKKSFKRSLPVDDEGISERLQLPAHKLTSKRTANPDRNSKLLQRFSSFAEEDFEDFWDDLKSSDKEKVTQNKNELGRNEQHSLDKQSVNETNSDILELFNINNAIEHSATVNSTVKGMRDVNNSVSNSSTASKNFSSDLPYQKNSLVNEKDSQKIFEMCNAKIFLAAIDASQKLSDADESLTNNEVLEYPGNQKSSENTSFKFNASPVLKSFRGSFQNKGGSSGSSRSFSKEDRVCRQETPNPEAAKPYLVQHSGNFCDVGGSSAQDTARPSVWKAYADHQTKLSSEVRTLFTVTSNAIKPKFPGPAGLLPNLGPVGEPLPSLSLGPLWSSMLQDLDIHPNSASSPLHRHNIERSVLRQHGGGNSAAGCGGLRRIPMLVVQVNAVQPAHSQATLLLSDHTG